MLHTFGIIKLLVLRFYVDNVKVRCSLLRNNLIIMTESYFFTNLNVAVVVEIEIAKTEIQQARVILPIFINYAPRFLHTVNL